MGEDGSADLQFVLQVANEIGENIINDIIVVNKSTVPIGTAEKVRNTIQNKLDQRNSKKLCLMLFRIQNFSRKELL